MMRKLESGWKTEVVSAVWLNASARKSRKKKRKAGFFNAYKTVVVKGCNIIYKK